MENDSSRKIKVQAISVITLFVFLFDIYVIVNMQNNYQVLGIAALVTLICVSLTISRWLKLGEKESQRSEEQYVDIMKAEKSTHLVSQKKFYRSENYASGKGKFRKSEKDCKYAGISDGRTEKSCKNNNQPQ